MHVVPGPWRLLVLNGAAAMAAVGVAAYVLTHRDQLPGDDWRAGALDLARDVRRAAEAAERPADPDRISVASCRSPTGLTATSGPPRWGSKSRSTRPFDLGVACQRIATAHRPMAGSHGPSLDDRLESLRIEADALAATVEDR